MKKFFIILWYCCNLHMLWAQNNIVLLDVSGSMNGIKGENLMPKVREQLIPFVNSLDSASIKVIPFTNRVLGQFDAREFISRPIVAQKGNTNIQKAVSALPELMGEEVNRIFLVTDGQQTSGVSTEVFAQQLSALKEANEKDYYYLVALSDKVKETPIAGVFDGTNKFVLLDSLYFPEEHPVTQCEQDTTSSPVVSKLADVSGKENGSSFNWWWLLFIVFVLVLLAVALIVVCLCKYGGLCGLLPLRFIEKNTAQAVDEGDFYKELREDENYCPLEAASPTKEERKPDNSTIYLVPGTNTAVKKCPDGRTYEANSGCVPGAPSEAPNYALDKPRPNSIYKVDGGNFKFETDSEGRTKYAEQKINAKTIGEENIKTVLNNERRQSLGLKKNDSRDAGHVLSHRLCGINEDLNLVPMNQNEQRSGSLWYRYEEKEARICEEKISKDPKMELIRRRKVEYYPGTKQPRRIAAELVNSKTGETLLKETFTFSRE